MLKVLTRLALLGHKKSRRQEGPTQGPRAPQWGWYLAVLAALAVGLFLHHRFFHDDAFITLRYAQRFLDGKGFTWNDGEHVEGFSNPFWLGQILILNYLGVPLTVSAQVLGLCYSFAILWLWHRAKADPVGLLALVTVPGFTIWAWGGLETLGAGFWILFSMFLVWKMQFNSAPTSRGILLGCALAAIALIRPEGILVSVVLLGVAIHFRRARSQVVAGLTLVVIYGAYESYRLVYFGDWIANAARAKVLNLPMRPRMVDAVTYLTQSSREWLAAVLVTAFLIICSSDRRRISILLLSSLPLLGVIVAGGGDHMVGARFMLVPVAMVCLAGSFARPAHHPGLRVVAEVSVVLVAIWQLHLSWRFPAERNPAAAIGEWVGRTFEERLPPGTLVALATAGSVPYFAPSLAFIDTLGINDRHIARKRPSTLPRVLETADNWFEIPGHRRGDGRYVLSRHPDIVMLGGAQGELEPLFLGDYEIVLMEAFRANFSPWRFFISVPARYQPWVSDFVDPTTGQLPITLYVRRNSRVWDTIAKQSLPLLPPWIRENHPASESR
jgi:hypothetical protein